MLDELIRRWWIVALRGIVAMVFGLAVFATPEGALVLLISLFGVFALAEGIFTIGAGLSMNWLSLFLEGVVGVVIGGFTTFYPPAAELAFVDLVVAWATITGILEVVGAFRLHRIVSGSIVTGGWLLGATGVLSILFGALLAAGAGPLTGLIGGYATASGALLVALGLSIRMWHAVVRPPASA